MRNEKNDQRVAGLLGRTGYTGGKTELERKLDTTRPTKGPVERPAPLERARGGSIPEGDPGRARGGSAKHHGKTTVNVVVPQGPPQRPAMPMGAPPPRPPVPPPGGPPGGPPPGGMPPGGAGMPPPGMPPGPPGPPMRPPGMKQGGAIAHKMKAGSASGWGRIEKMKAYGKRGK